MKPKNPKESVWKKMRDETHADGQMRHTRSDRVKKQMLRRLTTRFRRAEDKQVCKEALMDPLGRTIRRDEPLLTPKSISHPPRMEVFHATPETLETM